MSDVRVACIVGPTASGKSSVAELVAQQLKGEIVSVDSMQIYRGMDIGTAKTSPQKSMVPLHMVDITDIGEPYSVARFQREGRSCVHDIAARGRTAILCGGTGLYLDAVIDKMVFPEGEVTDSRRKEYEDLARRIGSDGLFEILASRDPKSAGIIHPHNVRRVIRALELCDEGSSYHDRNKGLKAHEPYFDAEIWALVMPREQLYDRIDRRVDKMFANGLVEEVTHLESIGLRSSHTASQAIGYREVLQYLDGSISLTEAMALVKRNTRRYAKRQLSWIRRDGRAKEVDVSNADHASVAQLICEEWVAGCGVSSDVAC